MPILTSNNENNLALKQLILSPEINKGIFIESIVQKLYDRYLDVHAPIDPLIEPDANQRALHQQFRDVITLNYTVLDIIDEPTTPTISMNFTKILYDIMFSALFTVQNPNLSQNFTAIAINTLLTDTLALGGGNNDADKNTLGLNVFVYYNGNINNTNNMQQNINLITLGQQYRSIILELINQVPIINGKMDLLFSADFDQIVGSGTSPTPVVPSTPPSMSISNIADTTLEISWNASVDNGGSPITAYEIYRKLSTESIFVKIFERTDLQNLFFVDTGLIQQTGYDYAVTAVNAVGISPLTPAISITTLQTGGTPTNPPTSLTDFLDNIVSELFAVTNGIFDSLSSITDDKLFEMKMLELLLAGTSELSIGDQNVLSKNILDLSTKLKSEAETRSSI